LSDTTKAIDVHDSALLRIGDDLQSVHLYQLMGRIWLVEFNAERARDISNLSEQQYFAAIALLSAYAVLEALILETALATKPDLYAIEQWRGNGLIAKYKKYLEDCDRGHDAIPDILSR
jgi:hypothetical protein